MTGREEPGRFRPGYENAFLRTLSIARKYPERLAAERGPDDPPVDESLASVNGFANMLHLQGLMIAHMATDPETNEELLAAAVKAGEQVPGWMELRVFGSDGDQSPGRLFALGCAQMIAEQRRALRRIIDEQIDEPEPLEAIFERWPVPTGEEGEDADDLFVLTGTAMQANVRVALVIARRLDEWLEAEEEAALAEGRTLAEFYGEDEEYEYDEELDDEYGGEDEDRLI